MGERRVVYAHNYDMVLARQLVREGSYPGQHLYGMAHAERIGLSVSVVPLAPWPALRSASRALGWRLGDVGQELDVLRQGGRRRNVVRYSGEIHGLSGLAMLRGAHLSGTPLVCVLHQPVPTDRRTSLVLRGIDVAVCLSGVVREQLIRDHGRDRATTRLACFGPDLTFPGYDSSRDGGYVISTGKTGRDLPTLLAALARTRHPARVYSLQAPAAAVPVGTEIVMPRRPEDSFAGMGQFPAARVIDDMRNASVVAMPLETDRLLGLTELADALALGKPIIATRSQFLDVDVEAIGCGRVVEAGDVDGWSAAIAELMGDDDLRRRMGAAARSFAESSCNERLFGEVVVDALRTAAAV
ncbi:MAG TPA: glycosyltransferase [Aeromicrobium sp.]|nr:glycosyltransferase [Aeromicrobium sp.]